MPTDLPPPPPGKRSPYPREVVEEREPNQSKWVSRAVIVMMACPFVPLAIFRIAGSDAAQSAFWLTIFFGVLLPGVIAAHGYTSPSKKVAIFIVFSATSVFVTILGLFVITSLRLFA